MSNVSELIGKTISKISGLEHGSDEVSIVCTDGSAFRMLHHQDCCESVSVDDVIGDPSDIIGYEVIDSREESNQDDPPKKDYVEEFTWTFYIIQTTKGAVTIRWLGESNGYYSESVDFERVGS